MGLVQRTVAVDGIELIAKYVGTLFAVVNRLAAAANAAAGAGHNFHEVIMNLACFELVEQLACITQAAYRAGTQCCAAEGEFAYLAAFCAANVGEGIFRSFLAFDYMVGGTQCCFHNAAAGTEDNCGAGALAQRIIKGQFTQHCRVDVLGTQQADKLACGEYDIYIMGTAAAHREESGLAFFGNAGHDGNRADFLRLQALLLCKIRFCQRTENLLRRFGGGKVRHEVRMSFVDIAYPAGAAGGEHRPTVVLRILQVL